MGIKEYEKAFSKFCILSGDIGESCWLLEANKLIKIARGIKSINKRKGLTSFLLRDGKHFLGCSCSDTENCKYWDRGYGRCLCSYENIQCDGVYLFYQNRRTNITIGYRQRAFVSTPTCGDCGCNCIPCNCEGERGCFGCGCGREEGCGECCGECESCSCLTRTCPNCGCNET